MHQMDKISKNILQTPKAIRLITREETEHEYFSKFWSVLIVFWQYKIILLQAAAQKKNRGKECLSSTQNQSNPINEKGCFDYHSLF